MYTRFRFHPFILYKSVKKTILNESKYLSADMCNLTFKQTFYKLKKWKIYIFLKISKYLNKMNLKK